MTWSIVYVVPLAPLAAGTLTVVIGMSLPSLYSVPFQADRCGAKPDLDLRTALRLICADVGVGSETVWDMM